MWGGARGLDRSSTDLIRELRMFPERKPGDMRHAASAQKISFIASASCRDVPPSPAGNRVPPVIRPRVDEPTVETGCVKLAWLKRSKAPRGPSRLTRSGTAGVLNQGEIQIREARPDHHVTAEITEPQHGAGSRALVDEHRRVLNVRHRGGAAIGGGSKARDNRSGHVRPENRGASERRVAQVEVDRDCRSAAYR